MCNSAKIPWIIPFSLIFLFLNCSQNFVSAGDTNDTELDELPVIQVVSRKWEYLDSSNTSFLGEPESQITLNCTARYPIKWVITGHQGNYFFHAGNRKTQFYAENYTLQEDENVNSNQLVYSVETWNYFEKGSVASVRVVCQSVTDDEKSSRVNIFVPDKHPQIICPPKSIGRLPRGNTVPCPVTDPRISVKLFKRNPHPSTHLTAIRAKYDPVNGFKLSDNRQESGTFICVTPRDVCTVFLGEDKNEEGFLALPSEKSVTQWSNATLKLMCVDKIPIEFEINSSNVISRKENEIILRGRNGDNGTITCKGGNHSHTWNYLFVDRPRLRFNCKEGEIDCISEGRNKSIASVRCKDKNDCSLLRGCFGNENCQNERQLYFTGEPKEGFCPTANYSSCISFRNLYFNGLIECGVANKGKTILYEFFTGLSLIKYENWQDAPTDELIRMDSVSPVLYANESTLFVCEASSYLFSDGFHYEIKFYNGSRAILDNDSLRVNKYIQERRQVHELNIVSAVEIRLPIDATELSCFVSLADEPIVLHASRSFTVKYLEKPSIFTDNQNVEFQRGSYRQRLICSARGEPSPNTRWEINGQVPGPEFVTRRTSEGDCILEFPDISENHTGYYKCIASNSLGNYSMVFNVTVTEEDLSTKTENVII